MTDEEYKEKLEEEKFESEALDEWAMIDDPSFSFNDVEKLHEDEV